MNSYEECLTATSTLNAPWYILPADEKENARLICSGIILETLKSLNMAYPKSDVARRRELHAIRKSLQTE